MTTRAKVAEMITSGLELLDAFQHDGYVGVDGHDNGIVYAQWNDDDGRRIIARVRVEKAYKVKV